MSNFRFFKTFLANPGQVGAVLPSGVALARKITDPIDFETAQVVVEFGPGTGPFTREILKRLKPGAKLIAFEINSTMADTIAQAHPEVDLVRDSAETLAAVLASRGIERIDAVVSGLPFANFPAALRDRILTGVHASLRPGGLFLSFTYYHSKIIPNTHRFGEKLRSIFKTVDAIPVLRNMPPAFVYRCEA